MTGRDFAVASLGGGHGLFATLQAVRTLTRDITAIVTVADDGGSSGRLRTELGIIPPGDLRMALAALLPDTEQGRFWAGVLQHRFGGGGAMAGHPVGNLVLAGLCEVLGDPVSALDEFGRRFEVQGRVLPMVSGPLRIEADVAGLEDDPRLTRVIRGQVAVAATPGKVRRVRLEPPEPGATEEAVHAIRNADVVTVGPGSWFSSVIPHVLVPAQLEALRTTNARRILILNLAPEPGETSGFSAERHLHVLAAHAEGLQFDDILIDADTAPSGADRAHLVRAASVFGAKAHFVPVSLPGTHRHDVAALASAIRRCHVQ
ncbi:uridine diphosphate-N-acetylglucosamine-binding protein YvcK [Tsukamurella sp. 8F]|uniref:gluconeogenesis factor YvcK family protein n=1 Tax=unclassified Tsukamurella TaxID=2633480 RepID=UPI0023BA2D15|nr:MULTISPECIES: uridine diphosphate-N-acetylglucosamine-binding protein YvcK [unclassified Tsukamurella]MDF0528544.1 uridine diphosphate-N-acetylglucosamine-binding protein YvcK [Tsukamurella sp. 8J]MDF0585506.1 uridine diphosphate-N-acetylglucosamine-binding protein YvcK [Tsukamurella sp. 8F]